MPMPSTQDNFRQGGLPIAYTALTGTPIAVKIVNSTDVKIENNTVEGSIRLEGSIVDSGEVVLKDYREV